MDDITSLKAEIARLRAVCEDQDIDPDYVPEGPIFDNSIVAEITREAVEPRTKIGTVLRIRLPADYAVTSEAFTDQIGPDYLGAARDLQNT